MTTSPHPKQEEAMTTPQIESPLPAADEALDPRVEAAAEAMWLQRPMMRLPDGSPRPWADVPERSYRARYRGQARVAIEAIDRACPGIGAVLKEAADLDALPENTVVMAPCRNPYYPKLFLKVGRNEWVELDPGDRSDGEDTTSAEGLLRWSSHDHTVTVLWLPPARNRA